MITQKRKTGDKGEALACNYLLKNGYNIVGRNYSCRFGEIDIIAKKGNTLHFIEVKTSQKGSAVLAEENITNNKIRKFLKTIEVYFNIKNISSHIRWQIDAIIIHVKSSDGDEEIAYLENINIR